MSELRAFVSLEAIQNANIERKGYAIGFSSYSTTTNVLIDNIKKSEYFKELIKYEEIVIIAVDING